MDRPRPVIAILPLRKERASNRSGPLVPAVSLLALCAAVIQPRAGRALDDERFDAATDLIVGLGGDRDRFGLRAAVGAAGLLSSAVLIGIGI